MFTKIASFLTSMRSVIIGMLLLIGFLVLETQTLFARILPADMEYWKVLVASILIAIVYEFTVLLFTANSNVISPVTGKLVAWASFFINMFFWQVWDGGDGVVWMQGIIIFMKVFASALLSWLNYVYADLFVKLYQREITIEEIENLRKQKDTLSGVLQDLNAEIDHTRWNIVKIEEERKARIKALDKTTCPHCFQYFEGQHAFNGHVGRCPERQ